MHSRRYPGRARPGPDARSHVRAQRRQVSREKQWVEQDLSTNWKPACVLPTQTI